MRRQLDSLDIRILEALGVHGPRNISEVAKRLNMPTQTVHDRIKYLKSHFSLYLQVNTYHAFIGLKKAFVFARATPGYERLLWESMKADGYWLFLSARCDTAESFYGIYGIPIDHTDDFERFVKEITKLGIAQNIELFWSTCIQTVNLTDDWYDHDSRQWIFEWDKWVKILKAKERHFPLHSWNQKATHRKEI